MAYRRTPPLVGLNEILGSFNEKLKIRANEPDIRAYKPNPKQFLLHTSTAKSILFIGGNRSGKTTAGAVESIYRLLGNHPYKEVPPAPVRGRACASDFDYGIDIIILPELQRWLPPSYLVNGSWGDSYNREHRLLTLANGSFLEFRSYAQEVVKFAGTSRHFCWYDEEPPQDIYNESQARLVDTGGSSFITMTPVEGMTWIYNGIYEPGKKGDNPNQLVIEVDMSENPHLSPEAIESYLSTLGPDERRARAHGEFVALGGKIFADFSRTSHVVQTVPDPVVAFKDWQWFASFDHGLNNPTAILWHAVSPDNKIITFSEHYASEMTVKEHAAIYHARNKEFKKVPDYVVGDPAMGQRSGITGTSILQEYATRDIHISCERTDVDSGINRMIQYLRLDPEIQSPRWLITENCVNLIKEMSLYRWKRFISSKVASNSNKPERPLKKDDHAIDSARYMFTLMPDLTPTVYSPPVDVEKNIFGVPPSLDSRNRIDTFLKKSLEDAATSSGWSNRNLNTEWNWQSDIDSMGY